MKQTVILGGGITGLAVAWKLSEKRGSSVVLLEKAETTGGLAGAVRRSGWSLDFGSHRIHEQYDPEALAVIRDLLGDGLLRRPRRGLVLINGKFLKYPPSIIQILTAFGPVQSFRFAWDYALALLGAARRPPDTFQDFTICRVGRSLYEAFYKPYAVKLWGMPPDRIVSEPALNRVKKFALSALRREISGWFRPSRQPFFYYPAGGIAQIADAVKARFLANGGVIHTAVQVERLEIAGGRRIEAVHFRAAGAEPVRLEAAEVVSTIPLDAIHGLANFPEEPAPPPFELRWRSLRILYLVTSHQVPGENETFYMPGDDFAVGRISEIRKYSPELGHREGSVVLTLEIPCTEGDRIWSMTEDNLLALCWTELETLGVVRRGSPKPVEFFSEKIKNLYPVQEIGWRARYDRTLDRLDRLENLYLVGRPALFLHCNIDSCLNMAFRLAEHLESGDEKRRWRESIETFRRFQVKD